MKSYRVPLLGFLLLFGVLPALSQTAWQVVVTNYKFTPADLTINAGDTVVWTNQQGFHNVVADDGSFTSGPASSSSWTYRKVFTAPGDFRYYCVIHGSPGGVGMSAIVHVSGISTGITDRDEAPAKFTVEQNYPNPFNPSTVIRFDVPQTEHVTVKVYDILGQDVATLMNGEASAGHHEIEFNAVDLPSGIYLYRVEAGNKSELRKMILLK